MSVPPGFIYVEVEAAGKGPKRICFASIFAHVEAEFLLVTLPTAEYLSLFSLLFPFDLSTVIYLSYR